MAPTPYPSPPWRHPSYPSSGALTPAQPIALARRPRGIVLAGALVGVHLRLRRRAPRGGGGGAVAVAELVDDLVRDGELDGEREALPLQRRPRARRPPSRERARRA